MERVFSLVLLVCFICVFCNVRLMLLYLNVAGMSHIDCTLCRMGSEFVGILYIYC